MPGILSSANNTFTDTPAPPEGHPGLLLEAQCPAAKPTHWIRVQGTGTSDRVTPCPASGESTPGHRKRAQAPNIYGTSEPGAFCACIS